MFLPPQLITMLSSILLQKMSGQVVRTHSPKLLSDWQSSILILWGFTNECLPLTESSGALYSAWSLAILKMGRLFDFHSHDGCSEGGRTIIILQAIDRDCWWDDLSSLLSFHSTGDTGQGVAGRMKRPGDVLSSVLLAGWVIIAHKIWSKVLLGLIITGSRLDVQIEGRTCHVSIRWVPCEAKVVCHVSA